jgi:hypothetical protein
MFFVEDSIMWKQVLGHSLRRFGGVAALLAVPVGCDAVGTGSSGYLEVLPRASDNPACDSAMPGHLQLAGMVNADVVRVTTEELCQGRIVRRELPAGLYSVVWQPHDGTFHAEVENAVSGTSEDRAPKDGTVDDGRARWALRGPSVVSVFPGQVTRLRVYHEAPDSELA